MFIILVKVLVISEIYDFEADRASLDLKFDLLVVLDFPENQDLDDFLLSISKNYWLFWLFGGGLNYLGIK